MRQQRKEVTPAEVRSEAKKLGGNLQDIWDGLEEIFEADTVGQVTEIGKKIKESWTSADTILGKKIVFKRTKPQSEE